MTTSGIIPLSKASLHSMKLAGRLKKLLEWVEWGLPVSDTWLIFPQESGLSDGFIDDHEAKSLLAWHQKHVSSDSLSLNGNHAINGDTNFLMGLLQEHQKRPNDPITAELRPQPRLSGRVYTKDPFSHSSERILIEVYRGVLPSQHQNTQPTWYALSPSDWSIVEKKMPTSVEWYSHTQDGSVESHAFPGKGGEEPINAASLSVIAQQSYQAKRQIIHHLCIEWVVQQDRWIVTNVLPLEEGDREMINEATRTTPLLTGKTIVAGKVIGAITKDPNNISASSILVLPQIDHRLLSRLPQIGGLILSSDMHSPVWMQELRKYGIPSMSSASRALQRMEQGMLVQLHARPKGQAVVILTKRAEKR